MEHFGMRNVENTKTMTLAKIEYLYSKISDQTLINYIKAGICVGSPLASDGVVKKGQNVFYTDKTVFEVVVAKSMMEQKNRKLEMPEIAIARRCAYLILSNEHIDPLDIDLYFKISEEILQEKFSIIESIKPEFSAIKISKKKTTRICDLMDYTAEWIMRYMWCSSAEINEAEINYFVLSGEPIVPLKTLKYFDNLKIILKDGRVVYIKSDIAGFKFKTILNPLLSFVEYSAEEAVLKVNDRFISINI